MQFELLPVTDIIDTAKPPLQDRVEAYELDDLGDRMDDLHSAIESASNHLRNAGEPPEDVVQFLNEAAKVERLMKKAISSLGKKEEKQRVTESMDAYDKALGGICFTGKFVTQWKKICRGKVCKVLLNQNIVVSTYLYFKSESIENYCFISFSFKLIFLVEGRLD